VIVTSNKSAVQAIGNPRQQSGQGHIREIYDAVEKLRSDGNRVNLIWLPPDSEFKIQRIAKTSARHATEPYMTPQRGMTKAKTTILNRTRADLRMERKLPDGVGRHTTAVCYGSYFEKFFRKCGLRWNESVQDMERRIEYASNSCSA
jgi:hypothetical protein